ncbi:hypothetical protein ACI2JA_03930 [Alkalihalobacillus sp. NPDC078783]
MEINVSNLSTGQIFKNYKELCEALSEKTKTGTSKQSQLINWERFFSYDKQGHKFIITHIHIPPKPKTVSRANNNKVKYIAEIEKLILDLLIRNNTDEEKVYLSQDKLSRELNMINDNYSFGKYNLRLVSQLENINEFEIQKFYESTKSMLKRNIEQALKNLVNQSLIVYNHSRTVCVANVETDFNLNYDIKAHKQENINVYGDKTTVLYADTPHAKMIHRKATEAEEKHIVRVQEDVMEEMGIDTSYDLDFSNSSVAIHQVFQRGRQKEFYERVNQILFDDLNILYTYKSYEILFNQDRVISKRKRLKMLLDQSDRIHTKYSLNHNVKDKIDANMTNKLGKLAHVERLDNALKLSNSMIKFDAPLYRDKFKRPD